MTHDKRKILFVGGIPAAFTESIIGRHFSKYCRVVMVRIMKEMKTFEPKGFAFVTLAEASDVLKVVGLVHVIEGRTVDVQMASQKGEKNDWKEEQKKKRIFVSNLPSGVSNEELASHFARYGQVHNAYIIRDYLTAQSNNYGYVEFKEIGISGKVLADQVVIRSCMITCVPFVGRNEPKQSNNKISNHSGDSNKVSTQILSSKKDKQSLSQSIDKFKEMEATDISPKAKIGGLVPNNPKYEYIGMSRRINEDESNYSLNCSKSAISQPRMHCFAPRSRHQSKLVKVIGEEVTSMNSVAHYQKLKHLKFNRTERQLKTTNSVSDGPRSNEKFTKMSRAVIAASGSHVKNYCCF